MILEPNHNKHQLLFSKVYPESLISGCEQIFKGPTDAEFKVEKAQ